MIGGIMKGLYKTEYKGNKFREAVAAIDKGVKVWESISGEQVNNTFNSHATGYFAELAAAEFIRHRYDQKKGYCCPYPHGILERETGKASLGRGDIEVFTNPEKTESYTIEVKGVRKGYTKGQITEHYANKYKREGVYRVLFVEVSISIRNQSATCTVYLAASPEEILTWDKRLNDRGQSMCFTHKDYF